MPDSLGRYFLSEMEDRVRRTLADVQLNVGPTGVESGTPSLPTQMYSTIDLDQCLNKAMIDAFVEMLIDHEDVFAQSSYISVAPNVTIYALPPGIIAVRWLRIKPESVALSIVRPDQWQTMVYYDEDMTQGIQDQFGGPTWRREGDNIVLGFVPFIANPNGIWVNAVVMPPELAKPTDVVQSQFARLMQNYMIYEAACIIGSTRELEIPQEVKDQRDKAHMSLAMAVDNVLKPTSVQLYSTRLVKRSYSGRWNRW